MKQSDLLKKLSSIVNDKKEKNNSWVASLVIFFISVFAIFIFAWVSSKNSKEVAKLKHEKNKKKVERDNLNVTIKRELNEKRLIDLALKIDNNKNEIIELDRVIRVAEKAHFENLNSINSITGWKDI